MPFSRDYSTDTFIPRPWTTISYTGTNGAIGSSVSGVASSDHAVTKRIGGNTPGWRALVRGRSRKPDNSYTISKITNTGGWDGEPGMLYGIGERLFETSVGAFVDNDVNKPVYITYPKLQNIGKAVWRSSDSMLPPSLTSLVNIARDRAVQKMLLQLKDSKFNGAVAYNEAGQVHKMIGGAATKIARALTDLKHGHLRLAAEGFGLSVSKRQAARYRHAMNKAKTDDSIETVMAQGVLMVQYGIRPLLNDIVGAAELYAQKRVGEVAVDLRTSSTILLDDARSTFIKTSANAYGPYVANNSCSTTGMVRVGVKIRYTRGSEVLHTLSQLGITNPALVAWEALPWSFVIDWFIPIGNWISSLDATLGLQFDSGCISTKIDMSHNRTQVCSGHVVSAGASGTKNQTFTREKLTAFPSPGYPRFKNPLSFEHALNGIALLVGVRNNLYK